MKKLLGVILSALFLMVGCNDDSSILDPISDNNDASQLEKGRPILNRDLDGDDDKLFYLYDSLNYGGNKNIKDNNDGDYEEDDIQYNNFEKEYAEKFSVNGKKGAKIRVTHSWKNEAGRKINLSASLIIPRNAYTGTLDFAMVFDLENCGMELYPSPFTFDKPVILNLAFSGLDLSGINPEEFVFDYLDGEPENIKYDYIEVDVENNMLEVVGAQIPHFSRYGWVRTK